MNNAGTVFPLVSFVCIGTAAAVHGCARGCAAVAPIPGR